MGFDKERKQDQIRVLEAELRVLEKYLPYADGGAYYQDKNRILNIKKKLEELR